MLVTDRRPKPEEPTCLGSTRLITITWMYFNFTEALLESILIYHNIHESKITS